MNSATSSHSRALLNFVFRGTSFVMAGGTATWSANPALYFGLLSASPSEDGTYTELTGGSYARKSVAVTDWAAASTSNDITTVTLANNLTFATPTANWGTATHIGVFSASTSGDLLYVIELNSSLAITNGNAPIIRAGAAEGITIRLD